MPLPLLRLRLFIGQSINRSQAIPFPCHKPSIGTSAQHPFFFAFNWMVQYGDQYTLDPSEFISGNFMFIMFFDPGTMFKNS